MKRISQWMVRRRADDVCAVAHMGKNLPLHASTARFKVPNRIYLILDYG